MLHFLALGGLLFLIYGAQNDGVSESENKIIVISPQRIEQIESGFEAVWTKKPTAEELKKLIEKDIREEVYYRDALALGLDNNDSVVRKRLRQKLEFLSDTGTYLQAPSEEQLTTYYLANVSNYQRDPRLAFEQIYLGEKPSTEAVHQALTSLQNEPAAAALELDVRSRLPAQLRLSRPGAIDNIFGPGFFAQLAKLEPGEWGGPITSAYGSHLARTLDGEPARTPSLQDIHDTVLKDYQVARLGEAREQDYARRRAAYEVDIRYDD